MADETKRIMSVRRITAPGDDSVYVDLKVIDAIRFLDEKDNGQEWELSFKNNLDAGRKVKVVEVGEDKLKVERISSIFSKHDTNGFFQEWETIFDDSHDPPVHYKTHKRKIYHLNKDGTKDKDTWIEVERIDAVWFKDPKENYQERIWQLVWPDNEDPEWDYANLPKPDKRWDKTSINPPWRLDPFQTIVDCSLGARYMLVLHTKGGSYASAGEHWVSAIPMKDMDSPAGKVAYSKKLATSVFTSRYGFPGGHSQFKISKDHHVLVTPIQFLEDGTVSAPPQNGILSYSDTKTSLFKKATTTRPPDFLPYYTSYDMALINWSGNTVYDSYGNKAVFSNTGVTVTQDRPWVKRPWAVAAVDENGGIYGTAGADTVTSFYLTSVWADVSQAQDDAASSANYDFQVSTSGPGESDYNLTGQDVVPFGAGSYSVTGEFKFPYHSIADGLDKITVTSLPVAVSGSNAPQWMEYEQIEFLGKIGRRQLVNPDEIIYSFTGHTRFDYYPQYAVGPTANDVSFTYQNANDGNFDSYTGESPIGQIEDARWIYPFGFSANGKTSVGLFNHERYIVSSHTGFESVFKIYRGNIDYTDTLHSALGISEPDFVYMALLDIKLSDIKKLK